MLSDTFSSPGRYVGLWAPPLDIYARALIPPGSRCRVGLICLLSVCTFRSTFPRAAAVPSAPGVSPPVGRWLLPLLSCIVCVVCCC